MSKDIIYREDAINLLWYFQDECCSAVVGDFEKLPSAETEIEIIRAEAYAKGIDSERKRISDWCRPKGEWIKDENGDYRCSECGDEYVLEIGVKPIDARMYFCPNCGARMKGADDEV